MPYIIQLLRNINRFVALVCGVVLLLTAAFILAEITLRAFSLPNLSGADEYSGYVMAGLASWGLAFALTEQAHIRIEMAVSKLRPLMRDVIDVIALSTLAAVAITVSVYGYRVLSKSLNASSRANTPLETPLWIPQLIWWSGWLWFSISTIIVLLVGIGLLFKRQSTALRELAGSDELADTKT